MPTDLVALGLWSLVLLAFAVLAGLGGLAVARLFVRATKDR